MVMTAGTSLVFTPSGINPRKLGHSSRRFRRNVAAAAGLVTATLEAVAGALPRRKHATEAAPDPESVDVRHVQPYEATKTYRCPGCDHEISPGTGTRWSSPRRARPPPPLAQRLLAAHHAPEPVLAS